MKEKGFTLIELLATIIILVVLFLITTPIIINVISNAKKGAFKATAYGLISASENTLASNIINNQNIEYPIIYTFNGNEALTESSLKLNYKGETPLSGNLKVFKDGKIELAIWNGSYCITKVPTEDKVKFEDLKQDQCVLKELRDKDGPEIIFVTPLTIKDNLGSFDLKSDVLIQDDSCEGLNCREDEISLTITGEFNYPTIGEYHITYTASDKYGNKTNKDRLIIVKKGVYNITTNNVAGGKVTSPTTSEFDKNVTFSITTETANNYQYEGLTIKDSSDNLIYTLDKNTYTFKMPESDIVIMPKFAHPDYALPIKNYLSNFTFSKTSDWGTENANSCSTYSFPSETSMIVQAGRTDTMKCASNGIKATSNFPTFGYKYAVVSYTLSFYDGNECIVFSLNNTSIDGGCRNIDTSWSGSKKILLPSSTTFPIVVNPYVNKTDVNGDGAYDWYIGRSIVTYSIILTDK